MCVNVSWCTDFFARGFSHFACRFYVPNASGHCQDQGQYYFYVVGSVGALVERVSEGTRANLFGGPALDFVSDLCVVKGEGGGVECPFNASACSIRLFVSVHGAVFPSDFFPNEDEREIFRGTPGTVRYDGLAAFLFCHRL